MHDQNIAHLDIKPQNVLFSDQHQVKLIDFGLAKSFTPGQKSSAVCGTLHFRAPEMFTHKAYEAPQADIWSLGITMSKLLMGEKKIPIERNCCSIVCKCLLHGMICFEPASRLTIKEIMRHPWLTTYSFGKVTFGRSFSTATKPATEGRNTHFEHRHNSQGLMHFSAPQ
uniref:sperm motility kinase 2B-like n=1 Tax=Myxine glutinosa TaxID=7769 RepID=UPI00358E57B0